MAEQSFTQSLHEKYVSHGLHVFVITHAVFYLEVETINGAFL